MAKRPRTPAQLANDERLRAQAKARKTPQAEEQKPTLNPGLGEEPEQTISMSEYNDLKRQVQELINLQKTSQTPSDVGLVGFFEKYKMGKDYYPDMTEKLANEPRLSRFAFKENYELKYWYDESKYTTMEGVRMAEPKFHLDLIRVVFDEDTGLPTNGRYIVRRLVFHEDPDAAIAIATEQGVNIDAENEKDFLDSMRYLRQRDWLMDIFYPKPASKLKNRQEKVIGNQVVEFYEINDVDSQAIPFGDLNSKLRV